MRSLIVCLIALGWISTATAQGHIWGKFGTPRPRPKAPVLFLDKGPEIVDFQLKRLTDARLLKAHRRDNDPTFLPVFREILSRPGIDAAAQAEAVEALVRLENASRTEVLLGAIGSLPTDSDASTRSLARMLAETTPDDFASQIPRLNDAAASKNQALSRAGYVGLLAAGQADAAIKMAGNQDGGSLLDAVTLAGVHAKNPAITDYVVSAIAQTKDLSKRISAAKAIQAIELNSTDMMDLVAPLISIKKARAAAVDAMLEIPRDQRVYGESGRESAMSTLNELVRFAEKTPKKERTSDSFLKAMSLADQLLAIAPTAQAKTLRKRLESVTVRLIRITTVEEEMRYDTPHFVVAAGKPVQIVLVNHDIMPHNLVIGVPGSLKEVAADGLAAGPTGGWKKLPYVPKSDDVLQATKMVASDSQDRITFDAPLEPGEYPYVCTFPQHWYRMYGVMVVVEDLDAYLKKPTPPSNPLGNTRSFVASWTVDELNSELADGMKNRTTEIGAKIFNEASCAGCHVMNGVGGKIGPDLTEIYVKEKGNDVAVLRSILEPSHTIEAKYAMQKILTFDGATITGILVDEDDRSVRLVRSAEDKQPIEVLQDDIDVMVPSSVSIMPKALMDQYTKEEIFELMAYLKSGGK